MADAVPVPGPATAPSTAPAGAAGPIDPRWTDMLRHFASGEFAERDAAQKQLDAATWRDTELLARLVKMTDDPEAKARIQSRLEALAQEAAISPPPLTLDVKDKQLHEVAAALAAQMKVKMETWPDNGRAGGPMYSLKVVDKPFWEIIVELNKQAPISVQGYDGLRLQQGEPGLRNMIISGGLAIAPTSITRSKTVNFQQPAGNQVGEEQLNLQYWAALDPRVQVLKYRPPELTEVIDDAGNVLFRKNAQQNANFWHSDGGRSRIWQSGSSLKLPPNLGKKIATAKGQMVVVVQLSEEKMEVADIQQQLKKPIAIGGQTLVVDRLEMQNSTINFNMRREQQANILRAVGLGGGGDEQSGIRVTFIDVPTGNRIWTTLVQGGSGGGVGAGSAKGPIKLELSVATKVKEMVLPFELKDLLLP